MEVYGNVFTKVEVNPTDVIEGLTIRFLNGDKWDTHVRTKDGKHSLVEVKSAYHNTTTETVICDLTGEDVKYYEALKTVHKYLIEHQIKK